jgi:predicted TPR repeat methyltransferase
MSSTELLRAGREHHHAGRLGEAEVFYRRAAELAAPAADARLNLGTVLLELGRLMEATEVLSRLVADHPELASGWVHLAGAIAPEGFAWEAHQAIARALKGKPDAQTLVAASMVLMTLEDPDAAETAVRRAVKMSPLNVAAWIQLGQILSANDQKLEAGEAYRRALAIEPANAMAAFFLAALGGANPAGTPLVATAPPEYVRGLFDGFAGRFDASLVDSLKYQTPQLLAQLLERRLKAAGGDAAGPLVMLDAGCGTGLCGPWLAGYRGRLVGVDLSRGMIAKAQARAVYDELITGEVVAELEKRPGSLDLIVAADVLVYIGDLVRLFAAAAAALRPGGMFLLSVEAGISADADFVLLPTQRFAHSMGYLRRLADSSGLSLRATEEAVIRQEKGKDVQGYLVLAERSA